MASVLELVIKAATSIISEFLLLGVAIQIQN